MAEEAKSGSRMPSHSSDEGIPNGDRGEQNRREQKLAAPSLGPNTVIEREPVEERLAKHEQSEVDARGLDKRRRVVGQSYGPARATGPARPGNLGCTRSSSRSPRRW